MIFIACKKKEVYRVLISAGYYPHHKGRHQKGYIKEIDVDYRGVVMKRWHAYPEFGGITIHLDVTQPSGHHKVKTVRSLEREEKKILVRSVYQLRKRVKKSSEIKRLKRMRKEVEKPKKKKRKRFEEYAPNVHELQKNLPKILKASRKKPTLSERIKNLIYD